MSGEGWQSSTYWSARVHDKARVAMRCQQCSAMHWCPPWFTYCAVCEWRFAAGLQVGIWKVFADVEATAACQAALRLGGADAVMDVLVQAVGGRAAIVPNWVNPDVFVAEPLPAQD